MARLVREETSMLSTLLGRRPPPIDVKGVGGPASKPLQENSDNKCYCGYIRALFDRPHSLSRLLLTRSSCDRLRTPDVRLGSSASTRSDARCVSTGSAMRASCSACRSTS
jgi:hypothetical protein